MEERKAGFEIVIAGRSVKWPRSVLDFAHPSVLVPKCKCTRAQGQGSALFNPGVDLFVACWTLDLLERFQDRVAKRGVAREFVVHPQLLFSCSVLAARPSSSPHPIGYGDPRSGPALRRDGSASSRLAQNSRPDRCLRACTHVAGFEAPRRGPRRVGRCHPATTPSATATLLGSVSCSRNSTPRQSADIPRTAPPICGSAARPSTLGRCIGKEGPREGRSDLGTSPIRSRSRSSMTMCSRSRDPLASSTSSPYV